MDTEQGIPDSQLREDAIKLRDDFQDWLTNEDSGLDTSINLADRAVQILTAFLKENK